MKNEKGAIEIVLIIILIILLAFVGVVVYEVYQDLSEDGKAVINIGGTTIAEIEKKDNSQIKINPPANANTNIIEDIPTINTEAPVSKVEGGAFRYFYNQLEDTSKKIYDGLLSNKENLKKGTYTINYGETFNNLLSQEGGQEKLEACYQTAIEAFIYDNPDVFYLEANRTYLNIQTTTYLTRKKYEVFLNSGEYNNYYIDGITSEEQINQYEEQIESVKNEVLSQLTGTTENKIKQIHDYLIKNIDYDITISQNHIYNIYGALVRERCVCEGYAKAFKYLTNAAGIESVIVIGTAIDSSGKTENHAWNYVNVDGTWYAIDPTWDDPITSVTGYISPKSRYKYYLKGLNTMNKDHITTGQFTKNGKVFEFPVVNLNDYE